MTAADFTGRQCLRTHSAEPEFDPLSSFPERPDDDGVNR
jgi:hypothetical protein